MTDDKQNPAEADDWLDDFGEGGEDGGFDELDQATLDQLLGGGSDDGGQQAAQEESGGAGDGEGEQAASEANPGAGNDEGQQATGGASADGGASDGSIEIDQASLDALLNSDDSGGGTDAGGDDFFAANGGGADDAASLDQSSIDALLGSDDQDFQAALDENSSVPSQSDIDELFAQAQEDGGDGAHPPADDDVDLNELFAEGPQGGSPAAGDDDFGSDLAGFDLEEESAGNPMAASPLDDDVDDVTLDEDIFGEETILEPAAAAEVKPWRRLVPVDLLAGASRRSLGGGLLAAVLLLGGGAFFALRGPAPEKIDPPPVAMPAPAPEAAPAMVNTPPEARGVEYHMPEAGGEVPLLLAAKDQEGDALSYEVTTPPQHGRLAGELPTPIYLPSKDFPGEDLLEYRVTDGKDYSRPATVLITGPDLRPDTGTEQPGAPQLLKPRQPMLQAYDITLKTLSTRELEIDWRKIWQQGNSRAFSPKVRVEIVGEDLHGELTALDPRRHAYRPDRLFSGSESISYRFRMGEATSKVAELRLLVRPGDFPPEIRFRTSPAKSYRVGETVVLDAGPTVDDDPATLSFTWQQVAGTPVKLERLNAEGSRVSFVVPSSFYTEENPGPVLQLTATDRSGQKAEERVKIATRSRRHSPLWQGAALDLDGSLLVNQRRQGLSALRPGTVTR